jgi:transposase-like protein
MAESNWHNATEPIQCPTCHSEDLVGHAKPLLEHLPDGRWLCAVCATVFIATSWAYRMTQRQLAEDNKDQT